METLDTILKTLTLSRGDAVAMVISACAFYALYKILSAKVFIPYLSFYEQREAASVGALDDAQEINRKASKLVREYEEKLNEEKIKISKVRGDSLNIVKTEIEKNIKSKEAETAKRVTEEREKISKEADELSKKISDLSEALSTDIVKKLQKEGASSHV